MRRQLQPKCGLHLMCPLCLAAAGSWPLPISEGSSLSREPARGSFCHFVMGEIITGCNQSVLYDDQQSHQSA